ncbi:OsmC family protein [Jannaschia sp. M317]|uniref:OsmC family protein n=1 Tax=Jannaschia sp. M317 TaxID=2867011 RepID=UPI0021A47BAB|nr:OsmC family protein [Jannaschia sp. M317]UWQ17894.1 OsmC family protein [Jannaschia sp. M317]
MAHVMPDLFKIHVGGGSETAAKTVLTARGHQVITDEPKERGGTDLHATPLETMLSSFLGCTNVITSYVAGLMKIKLTDMQFELTGHFDTRGVFGKAEVRKPFPKIELRVILTTDATDEQIAQLRDTVAEKCPVSVILREAGCDIVESWERA